MTATAPRVHGASSSRKLLHMLLCFTEARPTWTVADLAAELQLSVTSVYRYVGLLREVGLLDHAPHNSYRVTDLVQSLARASQAGQAPLAEVALPVMTRVRDQFDETILIARRGGTSAYCVDRVESRRPVRLQFERGQAMSLHAGSLSKILLAAMPTRDRDDYLAGVLGSVSADQAARLAPEALDRIHREGFVESLEEIDEGIWGCAAALCVGGTVIAALGTAAPVFRTPPPRREEITHAIREAAEEVSARLH